MPKADTLTEVSSPMPVTPFLSPASSPKELPAIILGMPPMIYGLMECMGGKEKYIAKLDSMFSEHRYWHGNEPCHQIAYLFNYAGQPWKTQREVRHIMETEYLNAPGGLSGNDDAGQMSAWYVFSAMGFYPVCPGTPYYIIGSPSFPRMSIRLENGKTFTILAHNANKKIYISSQQN